jgi:hypothetical protein
LSRNDGNNVFIGCAKLAVLSVPSIVCAAYRGGSFERLTLYDGRCEAQNAHLLPRQRQNRLLLPYRKGSGYAAKGSIFRHGRPVKIFEVYGSTIVETLKAASARRRKSIGC